MQLINRLILCVRSLEKQGYLDNQQIFVYYKRIIKLLISQSNLFVFRHETVKRKSSLIKKYLVFNILGDKNYQKRIHLFEILKPLNIPLRNLHLHFCRVGVRGKLDLMKVSDLIAVLQKDIKFLKQHQADENNEQRHSNMVSRKYYSWLNHYLISNDARRYFCDCYPKSCAKIVDSRRHLIEMCIYDYYTNKKTNQNPIRIRKGKTLLRQDHGSYLLGSTFYCSSNLQHPWHKLTFSKLPQLKLNFCSYLINNNHHSNIFAINRAKFLIKNKTSFWRVASKTGVNIKLLRAVRFNNKKFGQLSLNNIIQLSKYYLHTHQNHVLNKPNNRKNHVRKSKA